MSVEGRPTISTWEWVNLLTLLGLTLSGFRNYKLLFGQTTMGQIPAFCRKTDYVANMHILCLAFTDIWIHKWATQVPVLLCLSCSFFFLLPRWLNCHTLSWWKNSSSAVMTLSSFSGQADLWEVRCLIIIEVTTVMLWQVHSALLIVQLMVEL